MTHAVPMLAGDVGSKPIGMGQMPRRLTPYPNPAHAAGHAPATAGKAPRGNATGLVCETIEGAAFPALGEGSGVGCPVPASDSHTHKREVYNALSGWAHQRHRGRDTNTRGVDHHIPIIEVRYGNADSMKGWASASRGLYEPVRIGDACQ